MFFISHRGNINGIDKKNENQISYIKNAINKGFDVEVDVRAYNGQLYLGHDDLQVKVDYDFFLNDKIWCHSKDLEALNILKKINCIYFWHQNDDYTLTSNGYFWTFPGKKLSFNSICVLPELQDYQDNKEKKIAGICSDYIEKFKDSSFT